MTITESETCSDFLEAETFETHRGQKITMVGTV